MAVSDVVANLALVSIAGTSIPVPVKVEFPGEIYTKHMIRSAATGQDTHGALILSRCHQIKIELQEPTLANLRVALSIPSGVDPLAVGAQMVPAIVLITPFGDTGSPPPRRIKYYAMTFDVQFGALDGSKNGSYTLIGDAHRDANGKVFTLGE